MNKIKVFDLNKVKDDEINKFLSEYDVLKDGINIREHRMIISYFEKTDGLTKEDHIESLRMDLIGHQKNLLNWEVEIRWFNQFTIGNDTRPEGSRMNPSSSEANNQVQTLTKRVEETKLRMALTKKLIADLESGEFVVE